MIRKVSRIGPATLAVSLPSKWVSKNKIKKGDDIEVIEDKNSLKVQLAGNIRATNSTEITIQDTKKFMTRQIVRLYNDGYDEIKIHYHDNEALELIENALQMLIGFEITDIMKSACIVKNISVEIENEFDNILRKLFLITQMMAERCIEYLKSNDKSQLKKNIETEKITNKYTNFCERILSKNYDKAKANLRLYTIVFTLEQMADRFLDITNLLLETKDVPDKISDIFKETIELFAKYYETFYNPTTENIYYIRNKQFQLKNSIIKNLKEIDHPLLFHISALLVFIEHLNQITY